MLKRTLSPSSLGSIATCITKAFLSKECGLTTREESAALKAGSAGHAGLEVYFRSEGDKEGAKRRFEEEYGAWATDNVLSDNARSWENTSAVFGAFVDSLELDKLPYTYEPAEVEQHLAAPLGVFEGVEVSLQGFIDLPVRERATGARYIMDHKFTGWLKSDTVEGYKLAAQFKAYAWLWEEVKREAVSGVFVNVVEWGKLPQVRYTAAGKEYKCRTHGVGYSECRLHHYNKQLVPLTLFPEDLLLWKANAEGLVARYAWYVARYGEGNAGEKLDAVQLLPMEGTFGAGCMWCEFKRYCRSGRQRQLAESSFVARELREEV